MIKIIETAQGTKLQPIIEECKDILEKEFKKRLADIGIQEITDTLSPLEELVGFGILDSEEEKEKFKELQKELWTAIKIEVESTGEKWQEAHFWFVDRMAYTFLNRLFAIRVMEALDLLKESTLVPQSDLGNRSARMAKIQEKSPGKTMFEWWQLVLRDAFGEIGKDVRILFDESDVASRLWPDGQAIEQLIHQLNALNPDIYKTSDVIGWFYHYYVYRTRKGHKTMSSHGSKSPANPNYLSILNTVYTPRWMVRVLVDNSLGHWWQDLNPNSKIFRDSPFFIKKVAMNLEHPTNDILKLLILDPACGSGNFLVYTFEKLVDMYKETHSDWQYSDIIETILTNNLFGIDINRRPAQLSAMALYISAKNVIKTRAATELATFKMPPLNIICCDIRIPHDKNRVLFIQQFKDARIQKVMKDVVEQFDNADQLGSLIDIQSLQIEINKIKQEKNVESKKYIKLDNFIPKGKKISPDDDAPLDLVSFIETEVLAGQQGNIGLQLFGRQAKNAVSLAQVLMRKYDIIMGNPPFGLAMDATKKSLRKIYPDSYSDLISAFIDQSLRILKDQGYISMVSDFSFMHLPKFERFRENILLNATYIEYLLLQGFKALSNASNRPVLFILRKVDPKSIQGKNTICRLIKYNLNNSYPPEVYYNDMVEDIKKLNRIKESDRLPALWNLINQEVFLSLPRFVIDLSIADKFKPLLEFFTKYPRLDISQHNKLEKEKLSNLEIARAYKGCDNGHNDRFVRYWFECDPNEIRKAEPIERIENIPKNMESPFIPLSKGGGDIRYYMNNGYVLWWNRISIIEMQKNVGARIQNISLFGRSEINWSLHSGKPRGRFFLIQKNTGTDSASMSIKILSEIIDKNTLLAFLNSKFACFFIRIQTKGRMWQAGNIARLPIPLDFLKEKTSSLGKFAQESFELRREWDTGYLTSPIFSESLMDKVIKDDPTIAKKGIPKTGHPFCEEFTHCSSETASEINKIIVDRKIASLQKLLNAVELRFNLLTQRLDNIDDEINKILYDGLLDTETTLALDEYYDTFVGKLGWQAERDIWLKDFLMANLIDVIKANPKGIIPLYMHKEDEHGLYDRFIDQLCTKFDRDIHGIQSILKELELEQHLGKELKRWIAEDFFFYHCQRFSGRPIIWHFSSRSESGKENALDLFIDYHKITENTLPNIRVEYIEPLVRALEQRKEIGTLPFDDVPKIDELESFSKAFAVLEAGYPSIPNPNALTGNNAQKGKGDDQTWEWVFGEVAKIIQNGYKPDHFLGVLVNIIPLCLDLPEAKQKDFPIKYHAICPRGTLKQVLKKLDALDQLRNVGSKDEGDEEDDHGEGKKQKRKSDAEGEEYPESDVLEDNNDDPTGEDS